MAEARGLIVPIGYWVLGEACRRLQAWRREGGNIVPIAVNMSTMQLRDKSLPTRVADILDRTGLEAHFLEMEVAESSLVHLHTDASISTLSELSRMGIRITIDDLGDGCASLKQLQCFPINTVNLAPCFAKKMHNNSKSHVFTKALINFLKDLSFRVNAKGVETLAQLNYLEMQGCDGAQGFWLSKPLSATHFGVLLGPDHPKLQLRQLAMRHH